MSRFNKTAPPPPQTVNLAGGKAYDQSPELELVSILVTSFAQNKFYEKADDTLARLTALIQAIPDKTFVAKAVVFARKEYGMRSITHVAAAEIAKHVKGQTWTRGFFDSAVHRVDDVTEILSYYIQKYGKKGIPNSLRDGLARALTRFDHYALAKYKGEGKGLKLVDAVNLLHPKATPALTALMKGTLKAADTWETKVSAAGQVTEGQEKTKEEAIEGAWEEMIRSKKIGYFALLKNLRNILQKAPKMVPEACALLTDEKRIRDSLVLPMRFLTAQEQLEKEQNAGPILAALSEALEKSLPNIPRLPGKTCIAVDMSGSMDGRPMKIASVFAAMLYKTQDAVLFRFGTSGEYVTLNPRDSVLTLAKVMQKAMGGTDFRSIFRMATAPYDRFVILSDNEAWQQPQVSKVYADEYAKRIGKKPYIFSWDLSGDGKMQFPEAQTCVMAGLSEKVFDLLKMVEEDKKALIHRIQAVEL